jgi:predicted ArsR family transcriptional regulator
MPAKTPHRAPRKRPAGEQPPAPRFKTKKEQLVALLRRKGGQEIAQLTVALGWLPHTVRAALTGLRKNGFNVERAIGDDGRTRYYIAPRAGR